MPSTVRLHRVLAAKPEKLYRAFLEPDAMASRSDPGAGLATSRRRAIARATAAPGRRVTGRTRTR